MATQTSYISNISECQLTIFYYQKADSGGMDQETNPIFFYLQET